MRVVLDRLIAALLFAALAACGRGDDSALEIAFIGSEQGLMSEGVRLSPPAQHLRAATAAGLVGLDAEGQVVPALAERWIVTDEGRSYIFRLRDLAWPDGTRLDGETVRDALLKRRRELAGTSLGADLAQIAEIRAMTGRVVEIRLASPTPDFLQLLSQPELGLLHDGRGLGPMALAREDDAFVLTLLPPRARGLPETEDWRDETRALRVRVRDARQAIALFDEGSVDVVLGGELDTLPLVETGPLSRGTVRIDPSLGLFGLRVIRPEGFLSRPENREAISLALDREALIAPFNVGGWIATTRIVPPGLPGETAPPPERWDGIALAERQAEAARRVAGWERSSGEEAVLRIALPAGRGGGMLFEQIDEDLRAVGITAVRVAPDEAADLALLDLVARYGEPQWFLNQFHCGYRAGLCSSAIDALVTQALASSDAVEARQLFAQAEAQLTSLEAFIPFGQPIRWSLVRGNIAGFSGNRWGFHPLPALAEVPR